MKGEGEGQGDGWGWAATGRREDEAGCTWYLISGKVCIKKETGVSFSPLASRTSLASWSHECWLYTPTLHMRDWRTSPCTGSRSCSISLSSVDLPVPLAPTAQGKARTRERQTKAYLGPRPASLGPRPASLGGSRPVWHMHAHATCNMHMHMHMHMHVHMHTQAHTHICICVCTEGDARVHVESEVDVGEELGPHLAGRPVLQWLAFVGEGHGVDSEDGHRDLTRNLSAEVVGMCAACMLRCRHAAQAVHGPACVHAHVHVLCACVHAGMCTACKCMLCMLCMCAWKVMFMLSPLIFSSMPSSSSSEPTPAKALTSLPLSFLPSTAASCFFCLSEAAPSLALSALVTWVGVGVRGRGG